jgi:hypothetical protein
MRDLTSGDAAALLALALAACAQPSPSPPPVSATTATPSARAAAPDGDVDASVAGDPADARAEATASGLPAQLDPDGNDDPSDPGSGEIPAEAHFERVGRAPLSLRRICDLRPFADALYAAHANDPLGTDGATITRYQPTVEAGKPAFTVAFDWNRPGEPTEGGGAGQGFLRVHAIGGRLFVPDADPPHDGFGISEHGTEGYVFVSDPSGRFARPVGPHFRPPGPPDPDGGAGASVLPRAYHDLDAIRFRGRLYASTGAVPPKERAWTGPSPGALHVANASWSRWTYEVDYPFPWQNGVWRLGFLVRFKDRLFAGIQDYDGREPNDYVAFDPPAGSTVIDHRDAHPARITSRGAALTLRWYADGGRLYWIALERDGNAVLRVSTDGDTWRAIDLPAEGGRPTDITRFRGCLVVLTERRLYRLDGESAVTVAKMSEKKPRFELSDSFCAAPLAVYRNELYAGGQRDGALYRLTGGPEPPAAGAPSPKRPQ